MTARTPLLWLPALGALAAAGCGEVERSGSVGDKLSGGDVEVTLQKVDREVRVPKDDITGLSVPRTGHRLIGVRVRVCSDHGGAIGFDDTGTAQQPQTEVHARFDWKLG